MTQLVPDVTFKYRTGGSWVDVPYDKLFAGKRVVVFSLPGAFTPTCSSKQLPGYEELYPEFIKYVDDVFCLSVNDAFVMDAWFRDQEIKNVKYIPDGSGEFTYAMGMSVNKANLGFGFRSWRYAMVVNNGEIEEIFEEPGRVGNCPADPYEISTPENVLNWLEQNK